MKKLKGLADQLVLLDRSSVLSSVLSLMMMKNQIRKNQIQNFYQVLRMTSQPRDCFGAQDVEKKQQDVDKGTDIFGQS